MKLVTTSKPGSVRPRGVRGERVLDLYQQLYRLIERRTRDRKTAALFAEPRVEAATGAISWYSDSDGPVVAVSSLDTEQRQRFDATLDEYVTAIGGVIADLESTENPDQQVVAERLRAMLIHPSNDDLYLVGGQPVVVNWSCEPGEPGVVPVDLIGRQRRASPVVSPAGSAVTSSVSVEAPPERTVGKRAVRPGFGWHWTGWLLALAVLTLTIWFLLFHQGTPIQKPDEDLALLEEEIALHKRRDALREQLFQAQTACPGENCDIGRISGVKWDDLNGNGERDAGEPGLPGVVVFLDEDGDAELGPGEQQQVTDAAGEYVFSGLPAGQYDVREVVPPGYRQTFPAVVSRPGDGLPDKVLEFFDGGNGPMRGAYGSNGGVPAVLHGGKYTIEAVAPEIVLQGPPPAPVVIANKAVKWLALPENSFVTVGFVDERIIDGPGEDIFIQSFDKEDSANENADVFVSTDGEHFTYLGRVNELGTAKLDLASIGHKEPVKAIKVVGLDELGTSPGFDLISVRGLPGSVVTPGYHTVELEQNGVVEGVDFGNQGLQEPEPEPEPEVASIPRPATEYCPEDKIVPPTLAMVYDNSGSMAFPLNMPEAVVDRHREKYQRYVQGFARPWGMEALGQLFLGRSLGAGGSGSPMTDTEWVDRNMKDELRKYGPKRVDVAKPLMTKLIEESPAESTLGLVAFSDCNKIAKRVSVSGSARAPLADLVRNLRPDGRTPIARSMQVAAEMVDGTSADAPGILVLVTDGEESCQANPCAVAQSIKQTKPYTVIHVVKMGPEASSQCIAEHTGGNVYQPTSADELAAALKEARITAPFKLGCRE